MTTQSNQEYRPSLMQITCSVATAGNTTAEAIISEQRRQTLILARAVVYKIATEHGYEKEEIMWQLDRNRTVAYNYEANVNGHLRHNHKFNALCRNAEAELAKYIPRTTRQSMPEEECEEHLAPQPEEPEFPAWKGKLGWEFTAEEEREEHYAKIEAARFMEVYCRPYRPRPTAASDAPPMPEMMDTMDAAFYLGVSTRTIAKGVALGHLHRHRMPKDTSFWYDTAELDMYKAYLKATRKQSQST